MNIDNPNKPQMHIDPTAIYLDIENGCVIFGSPHGVYHLQPHVAVNVANAMLQLVGNLGYEVEVQTAPRMITDQERLQLISRVGHVMRSMAANKVQPVKICAEIVDLVLAKVM